MVKEGSAYASLTIKKKQQYIYQNTNSEATCVSTNMLLCCICLKTNETYNAFMSVVFL